MYRVLDTCGGTLREFPTFEQADNFRLIANRPDWTITEVKVLKPDKYLVRYTTYGKEIKTKIVEKPKMLTETHFKCVIAPLTEDDSFFKSTEEKENSFLDFPRKVLSWSKIEE